MQDMAHQGSCKQVSVYAESWEIAKSSFILSDLNGFDAKRKI